MPHHSMHADRCERKRKSLEEDADVEVEVLKFSPHPCHNWFHMMQSRYILNRYSELPKTITLAKHRVSLFRFRRSHPIAHMALLPLKSFLGFLNNSRCVFLRFLRSLVPFPMPRRPYPWPLWIALSVASVRRSVARTSPMSSAPWPSS